MNRLGMQIAKLLGALVALYTAIRSVVKRIMELGS